MTTLSARTPQRVLFIASRPGIAGGEVYLLDVFRHLDPARFLPIVAVPAAGAFSEKLAQLGIETFVLNVDYGWLQPPQAWYPFLTGFETRVRRLVDFMQRRGVALVHTNSNQVFEGAVAARLAGLHHVHVVHIPFQSHLQIYRRLPIDGATFAAWVGALSSAVVAVAEPVAASLCPPLLREQVVVIHNGIDLAPYRMARASADGHIRRELGIPPQAPLVAGVGRLHPDKGFDSFIDAAAAVRRGLVRHRRRRRLGGA
jgi:glycosyltransferase involved in cell wall biosynthesis